MESTPKSPIQVSDGVAKRNGLAEKYWESKSRISQLDAHNNAIFLRRRILGFFDWFAAKCEVFHFLLYVVRGKLPGGDVGGTQG